MNPAQRWALGATLTLACALAPAGIVAQDSKPVAPPSAQSDELSALLATRDPRAVPLLEKQFAATNDPRAKQKTALMLVVLGVPDRTYYDFLAEPATRAIANARPFPLGFDDQGQIVPKVLTDEFRQWCATRGLNPETEASEAIYGSTIDVATLAHAGDPRSKELFLRGLDSPNPMIAQASATGLARLGAQDAIPRLLAKIEKSPAAVAQLLAVALATFDDPRAAAAEKYLGSRELFLEIQRQASAERARGSQTP